MPKNRKCELTLKAGTYTFLAVEHEAVVFVGVGLLRDEREDSLVRLVVSAVRDAV